MRQSERAAQLMELLGLSEDELCEILGVDPLSLLSGQIEHVGALPILTALLDEVREQVAPPVLRRWVRLNGPGGRRPVDALLARDFAGFEDALAVLVRDGFVIRGG